jgi:hypothetical protein
VVVLKVSLSLHQVRDRLALILEAGLSLRCQQGFWLQRALCLEAWRRCPGRRGRLSDISVFLCRSVLYGAFVWARRALKN